MLDSRTLAALQHPKTIAIMGASDDASKISGRPLDYLLRCRYGGRVFPINPHRDEVQGVRSYAAMDKVPVVPDLAIVAVPAADVPDALLACVAADVPLAVVFSSGFAETGPQGVELQQRIKQLIDGSRTRVIGPNSLGFVSVASGVPATFSTMFDSHLQLPIGNAAIISQSGALAAWLLSAARNIGVGYQYFVSTGNEADITAVELAAALLDDARVHVIVLYLESIADGQSLVELSHRAQQLQKPVLVLKAGASEGARRAILSHTGRLTPRSRTFDMCLDQLGIVRVGGVEEILDAMTVLSVRRSMDGDRVAIVTISGGAGALAADQAADAGLSVPELDADLRQRIAGFLPGYASTLNPVDLTAGIITRPTMLTEVLRALSSHSGVDALLILMGAAESVEDSLVQAIAECAATTPKPVVTTWVGGSGRAAAALHSQGLACYPDIGRAIKALALLHHRRFRDTVVPDEWLAVPRGIEINGRTQILDEEASKRRLEDYVPIVEEYVVASCVDAVAAAQRIGAPVTIKILSSELPHKSEYGAVRCRIDGDAAVSIAAEELIELGARLGLPQPTRLLVARHEEGVAELLIGARWDGTFGPIVICGIGGVLTDLIDDVSVALAPVDNARARVMIESIRGVGLMDGTRGRRAGDLAAAAAALAGLSRCAVEMGSSLSEIDVNPLIVRPRGRGVVAVDALMVVRETE